MKIVPGAAYLEAAEQRVWTGGPNNVLSYPLADGTCQFRHVSEAPDLILLYAPGDQWYSRVADWNDKERLGIEIIHRVPQKRSHD
jgi:hypothetical protein